MAGPEWLFGPAGDLRPLPPPEGGVVNSVDRFGGIHTAINGGRTVDVLGYRARYEFELPFVPEDEYFRLEALYTLAEPRSLKLIDPMRRNLLSRDASMARPADATQRGLYTDMASHLAWPRIPDSPVSWTTRGAGWTGFGPDSFLRFDRGNRVPVNGQSQLTFSVYLKASVELEVDISLGAFIDNTETDPVPGVQELLPAGEWVRVEHVFDVPVGLHEVSPDLRVVSAEVPTGAYLQVMTPQLEYGDEATAPALGGGAITVAIEDMQTVSPRYPYQSVSLTLLEV